MLQNLLRRKILSKAVSIRCSSSESVGRKNPDVFNAIGLEQLQLRGKVSLRGRRFLPGADKETFPKFLSGPRQDFPLGLHANGTYDVSDWGRFCREELDNNLVNYGAVVFRGLPLSSTEDFQQLMTSIAYKSMDYVGGSAHRHNLGSEVYSASDEPPDCCIDLHNEMSYSPVYNKKFFLFCLIPPEEGGESVICKNSDLFQGLDKKYVDKIEKKKIRYVRHCPDDASSNYLSWQTVFETGDRTIAEAKMKELGFEWEWYNNNSSLTFWYIMDAFAKHYITNERIWFNQAHAMHISYFKAHPSFYGVDVPDNRYPLHCTYGDGEELEPEFTQQIREAGWSNAVGIPWKKGDVLAVDNMLVQHARLSFRGERKIMVALTNS